MGSIEEYIVQLKAILSRTIERESVDEEVAEVTSHLCERAEELRAEGVPDAEEQAVAGFGDVGEIARELAAGYPPKPGFDPKWPRWLPEIVLVIMLVGAFFSYRIWHGPRGVEAAAMNVSIWGPSLIIPGFFGALARLLYRRLRVPRAMVRMANYGAAFAALAATCLVYLEVTGQWTLTAVYRQSYESCAVALGEYLVMTVLRTNDRLVNLLWKMLHPRKRIRL